MALSIGASVALNTISSSVQSYIRNADGTLIGGNIILEASSTDTINAVSAAAAIAAAFSAQAAYGVSGAGALASNVILTKTNAFIDQSVLNVDGNVDIDAANDSEINAVIASAAFALSIGKDKGIGASVGLAWQEMISAGRRCRSVRQASPATSSPRSWKTATRSRSRVGHAMAMSTSTLPKMTWCWMSPRTTCTVWTTATATNGSARTIKRSPAEVQAYIKDSKIESDGAISWMHSAPRRSTRPSPPARWRHPVAVSRPSRSALPGQGR